MFVGDETPASALALALASGSVPAYLRPHPNRPAVFTRGGRSLDVRLWEKIDRRAPWECWPWLGGRTIRGERGFPDRPYGAINEGTRDGGRWTGTWRVQLLVLVLTAESADQVPRLWGEAFVPWLHRIARHFQDKGPRRLNGSVDLRRIPSSKRARRVTAVCDQTLCSNPYHLEWATVAEVRFGQADRRARREAQPGWVPYCCEPGSRLPPVSMIKSDGSRWDA